LPIFCEFDGIDRHEIIATLKRSEPGLRARGVSHAALFGSRARGDNIDLASGFTVGFDDESFQDDLRTVYAVTRCLEIIS